VGFVKINGPVPGPRSRALFERRARAVLPGLATTHPIFVAHAEGPTLTDVDGNVFLDFTGGIGVVNVGHARPEVARGASEQVARLTHACFQVAGYEAYVAVAEALCRLCPGPDEKRALLLSTGAEAVENAVKIARAHTKRGAVLCFEHAFHGRTLLGLSLTGKATPYKTGFGPFAPEIYRLPCPYPSPYDVETALKTIVHPTQLAAIVIEPVMGEGGFLPIPAAFLAQLRSLADRHGIVLVLDEVQTGFGRTGRMFASERLGVVPDLMTVAKSIAGGLPLAGVVGRAKIMDSVPPGGVGGTFAGNPVSCAAALAAIAILEDLVARGRPDAIGQRIGERMHALSKKVPIIRDVRGLGAMQAIELAGADTTKILAAARDRGLLLLSAGTYNNVIRFLAPLSISDEALDEGLTIFEAAIT